MCYLLGLDFGFRYIGIKIKFFSIIIFLLKMNKILLSDLSIKFNRYNFFILNYWSMLEDGYLI